MDYVNVRKNASNTPGSLNKDGAGTVSNVSLSLDLAQRGHPLLSVCPDCRISSFEVILVYTISSIVGVM